MEKGNPSLRFYPKAISISETPIGLLLLKAMMGSALFFLPLYLLLSDISTSWPPVLWLLLYRVKGWVMPYVTNVISEGSRRKPILSYYCPIGVWSDEIRSYWWMGKCGWEIWGEHQGIPAVTGSQKTLEAWETHAPLELTEGRQQCLYLY